MAGDQLSFFIVHGFALWSTWTFFSLFQLTSARYLKHHWKFNRVFHIFSGSTVLIMTLLYGLIGLYKMKGVIKIDSHGPLAITFTSLTALLAISGVFAYCKLQNSQENQSRVLLSRKIHQVRQSARAGDPNILLQLSSDFFCAKNC